MPSNPDGLDLVQVLKRETSALGGDAADEAPYDSPIEPLEDMLEAGGVSFVETGDTRPTRKRAIWPDGDDLRFRDPNNPGSGKTLTQLAAAATAGAKLIDVSFASNDGTLGLTVSATSYEIKGYLIWPGSSYIGTPASAKISTILDKAGTGYFKIYDITNGLQVAEGTTTSLTWEILDLGTLSNIASAEAIWEFQMKSAGSPKAPTMTVGSLMVKFS